jgi:hypothetical protein
LQLTAHQAKYIAHDLTLQHAGGGLDRLSQRSAVYCPETTPEITVTTPETKAANLETTIKHPENHKETPKKHQGKPMSDPIDMKELKALAAQLNAIRAQVKAQGGFAGDRELHQCPGCGLMEDMLFNGKLVTYWRTSAQPVDTGLRLK